MKRSAIRIIVLLGAISVIGIIGIQIYWMQKTFNLKEKQFNQSVNFALQDVSKIIYDYNNEYYEESCDLPYGNPVEQVSPDYFVVNVNCEIDASILEHYLVAEFEIRNIRLDFEYAIYDCSNDEMVYGNYISVQGDTINIKRHDMPKYNKFTYYFGVHFPSRANYIAGGIGVMYFFSAILILVIIFFTYSLFVILKQRRLTEVQKDFINNMTHEFKTPLSSIAISADVLSDKGIISDPDRLHTYADIIREQNKRLLSHVEKVLSMASIDRQKIKLQLEEIDINVFVQDVVSDFRKSIDPGAADISINSEVAGIKTTADKLHLSSIILNILDNAVKYCDTKPAIEVGLARDKGRIILYVSDNGIGIRKEHTKRIFQKFYRVPTGNVHNVKGFGLGLNYVRNLVIAHGWKIKVESEPGKGTVFSIYIKY
ncbi:MAG: HAMP domain-containing sensor histidine kinase [Bacteroidota bacterium]